MEEEKLRGRLSSVITKLSALADQSQGEDSNRVTIESVSILGRRLSNVTFPPLFIAFNTESGPLEPMPQRYRVPFPTVENFRSSVLQRHQVHVPEEEYADDF